MNKAIPRAQHCQVMRIGERRLCAFQSFQSRNQPCSRSPSCFVVKQRPGSQAKQGRKTDSADGQAAHLSASFQNIYLLFPYNQTCQSYCPFAPSSAPRYIANLNRCLVSLPAVASTTSQPFLHALLDCHRKFLFSPSCTLPSIFSVLIPLPVLALGLCRLISHGIPDARLSIILPWVHGIHDKRKNRGGSHIGLQPISNSYCFISDSVSCF